MDQAVARNPTSQDTHLSIDLTSPPTECPANAVVQKEIQQAQKVLTRGHTGTSIGILGGTSGSRGSRAKSDYKKS
jgi:hypothetical protein